MSNADSKSMKAISDLEPGYPVVNELSAVLEKIIYTHLVADSVWFDPKLESERVFDRMLLSFARGLRRDGLAGVAKSVVRKVIFDDEINGYRIAEPGEREHALDGVVRYWDASPELVQMYRA
jgi:hypothetical protein